jgi:type VI secretion system protein ImpL
MNMMNLLRPMALATSGAGGLVFLTFWLGPQLGLKRFWLVLIVLGIMLAWIAVVAILRWRANKAGAALEKSIEQQAQAQIASSRPGREREIENLKNQLLEAIHALKTSRAGKGRGGSGALYVLPWYMIIGPPASGKTTLLANSGLNFPYLDPSRSRPSVKGVGGTRNCDWWFADEAVILDTAGRYVLPVEADDTQEWLAFLDLLRKHRKKKPINGLIVGVSIQDLIGGGEESVEHHAQKIRTRIDELIKQLGISFPIYVVFTKCDLIRGFVEFFGELSKTERAAAWGATFAIERIARERAVDIFGAEMDRLVAALRAARIPRLSAGAPPATRPEILFFPLQLGAIRERLSSFIEILFRENPYQERPVFRGVYFTSGTQEGRPIDQVINAMLRGFGVSASEEGMYVEPSQTKSYFIENVFSRVVFPDRHIAGPSAEGERRRRAMRVRVFAAGCFGLGLLTIALIALSASNRGLLGRARALSDKAAASAQGGRLDFSMADLKTLESLRATLDEMDRRGRAGSKVLTLATYQGERAAEAARRLYLSVLHTAAMSPAAPYLVRNLKAHADSVSAGIGFTRYYDWYRTWRILQDPADRLKKNDAPSVARALADYWSSVAAGGGDRAEFARLLEKQLEYASRFPHVLADVFPPDPRRDETLDFAARRALQRYWSADGVYASLIDAGAEVPAVTVASLVGAEQGLSGEVTVPGALSIDGWSGPVRKALAWIDDVREDWALRDAWDGDVPRLRDALVARYAREYGEAWARFLGGVRVRAGGSAEETGVFLERAATEGSPVLKLLRGVAQNTRFDKDSEPGLLAIEESYGALHEFFSAPGKGNAFRFLKGIASGDKAPYVEYVEKVGGLKDAFAELAASRSPQRSKEVLALTSWVETRIPGGLSTPVNAQLARVLKLPASAVTGTAEVVIGGELQGTVQDAWGPVAREFQETLAGRYPLAPGAKDAALSDFERFFSPTGTFWTFYQQALSEIVSEDGQQVLQPQAKLSPAFLSSLRTAYRIRRALFSDGGGSAAFSVSLQTEPPQRDPKIVMRSVRLEVGGQSSVYQMGPRTPSTISWPGRNPEAGAALKLDAGSSAKIENLEFEGAWGLFRLLDRAEIKRGGAQGEVSLVWKVKATPSEIVVKYDARGLPATHPFQRDLFRFSCPAQIVGGAQ